MDEGIADEVCGSIASLEEETSVFRAKGYLWRPGQNRKVSGEITFSHGGEGAVIRVFGYPDETKNFDGFLRGCIHPMRHVAIRNCQEYQRQKSTGYGLGTESAELGFIDMWVGDLGFDGEKDIAFESYSFGITNLNVWLGCGCFPLEHGDTKSTRQHRLIFEDELVRVYLAFLPVESVMERPSRNRSTHREPCVFIKSKCGLLPYYGESRCFAYYENRLATFFGMLIGKDAVRYGRCGRSDYSLSETVNSSGVVWRLNRRSLPRKLLTPLKKESIFVPYEVVAKELSHIVENFFKLNDEISRICGRLVYFRFGQESIPYGGVPELVFMFEGLARNLYADDFELKLEQMTGYRVHKDNVARVKASLKGEPELMRWLSNRLNFNPDSLQKMFDWARLQMKESFYYLDNDDAWMAYTKYLRARRDGFAHSETKLIGHDKMYLSAYFWLESFMMGIVLLKCGVPPEILRRGVATCPDFCWGVKTYYEEFCPHNNGMRGLTFHPSFGPQ